MTSTPYFLVGDIPAPGMFVLDGDEGRHAAAVRRLRSGELLVLTDGRGRRAQALVAEAGRDWLTVDVQPAEHVAPPNPRVVLVQALPKGERAELAVELATEAGVDAVMPWAAARCVARWTPEKAARGRERWRAVAAAAAKQSRRPWVPDVLPYGGLPFVLALMRAAAGTLLLHEGAVTLLRDAVLPARGDLVLVAGPEGGIAPEELAALTAAGAAAVRLGPEVLRSSTAAAVALGALGVLTGRWA